MSHTSPHKSRAGQGSGPAPSAPAITFDLKAETAKLRDSKVWSERGLASRTLLKHSDLRLVLMSLKSGEHIPPHNTERQVSIQAVEGHVRLKIADEEAVELPAGFVLALDHGVLHDVLAIEDSVILLTLGGDSANTGDA